MECQIRYAELIKTLGGENDDIAVFHNRGVDIIKASDFQKFDEASQVDYGEQGKHFEIYFVISASGSKYTWREAQQTFTGDDE